MQRGLYEYSIPRDVSPAQQTAVVEPNGCAAPSQSIRRALVDGPAGSPILIHSITADNDRLNGPPSLDELRCAPAASRTPGILLWPRTSPSNLIQAGLERARCCRRLWCALLCAARAREKTEELPRYFLRNFAR